MTLNDRRLEASIRKIRLGDAHQEHIYTTMLATQRQRYLDWLERHEELASNREYYMPRVSDFYHRAHINQATREALHVTRRAVVAVTRHAFAGSEGYVAQLSSVLDELNARVEEPGTAGHDSLMRCHDIIKRYSYNISEGPSFVRTPMVLPVLEQKYYVDDLKAY